MVFSSLPFLYIFLPGTLVLYFAVPGKYRNVILLLASLVFYFCGAQLYLLVMLGEILLTYLAGLWLSRPALRHRKPVLVLHLVLSLAMLGLFKYAGFAVDTLASLSGRAGAASLRLILPIGISFYTFQCISYVVDVYRGRYPAERDLLRFATYVSFFPQLIAGPIVRFDSVREALRSRTHSFERFASGAFRFTLGLGKKVLIADRLFAFCTACETVSASSVLLAWAESAAFLLYVYFDFSGYSDMAIGLGKCFGFDIPENFRYPLISRSVREFWRRWHISLGSWFRDYVYIPLGGSRRGLPRQAMNLLLVWLLTGIWHGAGWNFMIWGLSFGALLCAETLLFRKREQGDEQNYTASVGSAVRTVIVFLLSALVFVWFRFPTLQQAAGQFSKMFASPVWSRESAYLLKNAAVILVISLVGATPLVKVLAARFADTRAGKILSPWLQALILCAILALTTAYLVDGSFSPFLYFRF